MKTSTQLRKFIFSSFALAGLCAAASVGATDTNASSRDPSCRDEVRRVAIWPQGNPKAQQIARFEHRSVTVCNGKVASKHPRVAAP